MRYSRPAVIAWRLTVMARRLTVMARRLTVMARLDRAISRNTMLVPMAGPGPRVSG